MNSWFAHTWPVMPVISATLLGWAVSLKRGLFTSPPPSAILARD